MELATALLAGTALLALAGLVLILRQGQAIDRLRLLAEQVRAGQESATATQRAALAETERAIVAAMASSGGALRGEVTTAIENLRASNEQRLGEIRVTLSDQLGRLVEQSAAAATALRADVTTMRTEMAQQATTLREENGKKLTEIQTTVNEQLHAAVEKQMAASFTRVTEQFAQVQKAMGEMQAVGAQIGDIKRLFGNIKTRGGWGETQLRAMLDDILPAGAYDTNWRPRPDSRDAVEFAVIMPGSDGARPRLPIDAKFPTEDYERLLEAQENADAEADRAARAALARRIRDEARKLAEKYIAPPATVDFAVLYLPTDGLYAEVARIPGLLDEIGRLHHVVVLGPSLFPALLRTIHLGYITLSLEQKADEVRRLLGATRGEMQKIDILLDKLAGQASTMAKNLSLARRRTRAVERTLVGVVAIDGAEADRLIGATEQAVDDAPEPAEDSGG